MWRYLDFDDIMIWKNWNEGLKKEGVLLLSSMISRRACVFSR